MNLQAQEAETGRARQARRKVAQIVGAATRLFLERGYAATTMDDVAHEAGVSKATLYVHFGGKDELFATVVQMSGDQYAESLNEAGPDDEPMPQRLLRFGRTILGLLLAPEIVASYRMVAGEAMRSPGLGQVYYEKGAVRLLDRLEQNFALAMRHGLLRRAHPRRAAEQFIGLIRGDLQLQALFGVENGLSEKDRDAIVRSGVDVFYRAYAPPGGAATRRRQKGTHRPSR